MKREFLLPASPAIARRLLHLQSFGLIEIPDGLAELAAQDCLTPDAFNMVCPYSEELLTITQFLLDCDLRAIIQQRYHPCVTIDVLCHCIGLAGHSKLTILSKRRSYWTKQSAIAQFDHRIIGGRDPKDWIDRRDGVLLIDLYEYRLSSQQQSISRVFPRSLLYQAIDSDEQTTWPFLAELLWPTMPSPLIVRLAHGNPSHWQSKALIDFALFYNVVLFKQYITSNKLASLQDDILLRGITIDADGHQM